MKDLQERLERDREKTWWEGFGADDNKQDVEGWIIPGNLFESLMQGLQEAVEDAQGKHQLKRDVLSTEDTQVETRGPQGEGVADDK
jgi:hypothetical protein